MNIAIQLSGQPRFTQDFNLFLENLIGYESADWFIYLSNTNHTTPSKEGVQFSDSWENFDADWAIGKISSKLPKNNFIKRFEISNSHLQQWPQVKDLFWVDVPERVFMMHYNIFQVNELRKHYQETNGVVYDLIIRVRSDVSINSYLDVSTLNIHDDEIIMPKNDWSGVPNGWSSIVGDYWSNDLLAIGKEPAMNVYSTTIHSMKKYNDAGVWFHPETLLAYHLSKNKIKTIKGDFNSNIRQFPIDRRWN
jgi:hypothetical protein